MLRLQLLSFGVVVAAGCVSPVGLVREGHTEDALRAADEGSDATRARVLRALLEEEAPTVKLEPLGDNELARLAGAHTARGIIPHWVVVRATVTSRGRHLRYPRVVLALGRDARALPSFGAWQPTGLAAATAEAAPEGSTSYSSPLCELLGDACLALPLALLTLLTAQATHAPPTMEQLRKAAPRAWRLGQILAGSCDQPGTCTRYFLVRRPGQEAEPLSLRVRVSLARTVEKKPDLDAIATTPLAAGPSFAERLSTSIDVVRAPGVSLERHVQDAPPPIDFCAKWESSDWARGDGPCLIPLVPFKVGATSRVGLVPPPPPEPYAKREGSAGQRPSWAERDEAPERPRSGSQDPAAPTEMIGCSFKMRPVKTLFGMHRPAIRAARIMPAGEWTPVRGRSSPTDRDELFLPFAHVDPDGEIELIVVGNDLASQTTLRFQRRGALLVGGKIKTRSGTDHELDFDELDCVPYDRAAAEAEVSARWEAAVDAIDVAAESPDPNVRLDKRIDGLYLKPIDAARRAVRRVAWQVGWGDPRVVDLVARLAVVDKAAARVPP